MNVWRAGLESGFEQVERVAHHYAYGAADVAGPEVGRHWERAMQARRGIENGGWESARDFDIQVPEMQVRGRDGGA